MKSYKSKSKRLIYENLYKSTYKVYLQIIQSFGEFIQMLAAAINGSNVTLQALSNPKLIKDLPKYGVNDAFIQIVTSIKGLLQAGILICHSYKLLSKQSITQICISCGNPSKAARPIQCTRGHNFCEFCGIRDLLCDNIYLGDGVKWEKFTKQCRHMNCTGFFTFDSTNYMQLLISQKPECNQHPYYLNPSMANNLCIYCRCGSNLVRHTLYNIEHCICGNCLLFSFRQLNPKCPVAFSKINKYGCPQEILNKCPYPECNIQFTVKELLTVFRENYNALVKEYISSYPDTVKKCITIKLR